MLYTFLSVFVVAILFNWYTILFGKKDLQQLKQKLSIRKYLNEIEDGLDRQVGFAGTTIIKLVFIALSIIIVIWNALFFILILASLVAGTVAAKKLFQVGAVSNILNKIATYINRVR